MRNLKIESFHHFTKEMLLILYKDIFGIKRYLVADWWKVKIGR